MKKVINPSAKDLFPLLTRPALEKADLETVINAVFDRVESEGDAALMAFTAQFDGVQLETFIVSEAEIEEAVGLVPQELKDAIEIAANNIATFHSSQVNVETSVETTPGVRCWRKSVPIERVGFYIPGGSAPLFSTVLMLAIPATIAKCPTRIMCTPANKEGKVNPAILYAAKIAGVQCIYKLGGAQAIAAMTIGTAEVPEVDKIFGPGNQYVVAAKQKAQSLGKAIDMPAGPSEVMVVADNSVLPSFVAADLLAQAEHGPDSQVVFVSDSELFVDTVFAEVEKQLANLPRKEIAALALENSVCIVLPRDKWLATINDYAPEHLIVMGEEEERIALGVKNAGSVFLGSFTAESFGDYASGTNHTLPTAGFARAYSGVSFDSFVKKLTFQRVSQSGLTNLGPTVITMAEAEELQGHANAIKVRLNSITPQ